MSAELNALLAQKAAAKVAHEEVALALDDAQDRMREAGVALNKASKEVSDHVESLMAAAVSAHRETKS